MPRDCAPPVTSKPPLLLAATVPAETWPSPQVMVAVNLLAAAAGSASLKEATVPENAKPSVALMAGVAATVRAPSATEAVFCRVICEPPRSCTSTRTGKDPGRAKVLAPATLKPPPVSAVTVPAERWPSPQSMVAVKSVGSAFGLASAKVATVPLNAQALSPVGGDQPHNNLMPYLALNFCIALLGVFPPRT